MASKSLEKLCLEFILPDEYMSSTYHRPPALLEFDLKRIFNCCENLKVFTIEFKNSYLLTPPVGYNNSCIPQRLLTDNLHCLSTLVHVQLGQIVQNSAVSTLLLNCPNLKHLHANTCPDLKDHDLSSCALNALCKSRLECFYVYEAPQLTGNAFQTLIECFPELCRFGNLTRWAVNCEGIQNVVRTIKTNNYEVEILCGSHWFSSKCSGEVNLICYNAPPKSEY